MQDTRISLPSAWDGSEPSVPPPRDGRKAARPPHSQSPALNDEAARVLDDLAAEFRAFVSRMEAQRQPSTLDWYTHVFRLYRRFLEETPEGTAEAIAARMDDLDGFTDWNLRRGVSPIAANTYWRGLRTFFNERERLGGARSPYRTHKAPGFQPPDPKALSSESCARILLAAMNYRRWDAFERARAAAVIGVMLYAGLRRSEALALVISDVNFQTGEIRVDQGKGRWGGKRRFVPIHAELARLLRVYLRERGKRRIPDEAPEFFSSTRSTAGLGASMLRVIIRTVARAAGVPFTPHMLRHSFVTHLLRSDVPLFIARDLAGHSHIETTLLYTKVFAKDRHKNLQKLSFE